MIIHCDTTRYIWEVLEKAEYDFIFDNLRVLDLGCNIGAFSLWIYPRTEKIWAVDMDEKMLNLFKKTIKDNEMNKIVVLQDRVLDLASFMSGHAIPSIDLLKIDIEGEEYEIFSKKDFPVAKIRNIVGEYHRDSLQPLLTSLGYEYMEIPNKHFLARRI